MRSLLNALAVLPVLIVLSACQNKTVQLLTGKWDCIQVDNMITPGSKKLSTTDSADIATLKSMLQTLNWTFKDRMRYTCAVNERTTVEGKYELLDNDKVLVCTSASKNTVNRYIIKALTENELVLSGSAENTNLVLHFKPHR